MNKQQAYNAFWKRFGVLAFEENSVPDDDTIQQMINAGMAKAKYPYITYQTQISDLDTVLMPTASIWDKSTSYERVDLLANEIASEIAYMTPIKLDEGRMFITFHSAQHQGQEDTSIKRNVLTLGVEFLTSY